MSIQYPSVPALPGVPTLARLTTAAQTAADATISGETQALASQLGLPPTVTFGTDALYSGLGLQSLSSQQPPLSQNVNPNLSTGALPSYGIASQEGSLDLVIQPDSVLEFEINADSDINSHPVEPGAAGLSTGFQSYNRVQHAVSIRMLLACQGKNMTRSAFVQTLESLREGTQIVTIATPDTTYSNMVLKGFNYKKTAERGAVTIWADTQWLEERSANVVVSAPQTSQPQGNAVDNLGSLYPTAPDSMQQSSISNPLVPPYELPYPYALTMPPSGDAF